MQSNPRSVPRRSIRMVSAAAALAMLVYLPGFSAEPIVKTVRWVASDPSIPHDTYAYREITLKATSSISGRNIHAVWDFGDGTQSAVFTVENPYDASAKHV